MPRSFIVLALALALPLAAQAQDRFIDTQFWKLDLKAEKLGKLQKGSDIYYYFLYELENKGESPRKVDLNIFAMINVPRQGVSADAVKDFKSFEYFKLPAEPERETSEFDNTGKLYQLKRFYDGPYDAAMSGGIPAGYKHTWSIGTLGAGQTAKGVAVFKNIDPEWDFAGIMVKGLLNRIRTIADQQFLEDKVLMARFHSPGSATHAFQNPIYYRRPNRWVVMQRKKITYP